MKVRRALAAKLKYREYIEDGRVVQYRESMRLRQRERHLDPKIRLIARAKSRARAKKVECTLNPGDLIIPDTCPVLGTPFVPKTEYAMSIDAIDPTKIHNELGWLPETRFEDGLKKTIKWYLDNESWWKPIISGEYQDYYEKMYGYCNKQDVPI